MQAIDLKSVSHHITQLAQWHHEAWGHLNPERSVDVLADQMREYLSERPIPRMFVCEDVGQLMGSSSLIACDMDTHPELSPWLANVYVSAQHRNKGIGKVLVSAVLSYAKSLGLERIYLFTESKENFYLAQGWTTVSREHYKGDRVTIMEYVFAGK